MLLLLLPFCAKAQHRFEYLAQTEGVAFYIDNYTTPGKANTDTIWEKRVILDTPEGQAERARLVSMFKKTDVSKVAFYYVKEVFNVPRRTTKYCAIYLFDKQHDELGALLFPNNEQWQPIEKGTVTEMQLDRVKELRKADKY